MLFFNKTSPTHSFHQNENYFFHISPFFSSWYVQAFQISLFEYLIFLFDKIIILFQQLKRCHVHCDNANNVETFSLADSEQLIINNSV